jgi:hypothetical protein
MRNQVLNAVMVKVCMRIYEKLANRPDALVSREVRFDLMRGKISHVMQQACAEDGVPPTYSRTTRPFLLETKSECRQDSDARRLYKSLIAILQFGLAGSHPDYWREAVRAMALEICRFAPVSLERAVDIENGLKAALFEKPSGAYLDAEEDYHRCLLEDLKICMGEYQGLDNMTLHTVAVVEKRLLDRKQYCNFHASMQDGIHVRRRNLAMRLAHIGVLHWRRKRSHRRLKVGTKLQPREGQMKKRHVSVNKGRV